MFLAKTRTREMKPKANESKCDETKPTCIKCVRYGVLCNYSLPASSDLQLSKERKLDNPEAPGQITFDAKPLRSPITVGVFGPSSFTLSTEDLARLSRFQCRTAYTFATARSTGLYKNEVVRMALEVSSFPSLSYS